MPNNILDHFDPVKPPQFPKLYLKLIATFRIILVTFSVFFLYNTIGFLVRPGSEITILRTRIQHILPYLIYIICLLQLWYNFFQAFKEYQLKESSFDPHLLRIFSIIVCVVINIKLFSILHDNFMAGRSLHVFDYFFFLLSPISIAVLIQDVKYMRLHISSDKY